MNFFDKKEVVVDVFGDFACFTRPEAKVERVSYQCITPSGARGILSSIYAKPVEFYYQITKIEIMNPIKTICIKRNETKEKINDNLDYIYNTTQKGEKGLTQRNTEYLKNVYYRIHAEIIKQPDCNVSLKALYEQFERRVSKGKCFSNVCLGVSECECFFKMPDYNKKPCDINLDIGIMQYDIFDIRKNIPLNTNKKNYINPTRPTFFKAKIEHGILNIPRYESQEVLKIQEETDA